MTMKGKMKNIVKNNPITKITRAFVKEFFDICSGRVPFIDLGFFRDRILGCK